VLTLSWKVDECKPLAAGRVAGGARREGGRPPGCVLHGRGLHSPNSQLNLSALYGIGGARRGYVARVKGVV